MIPPRGLLLCVLAGLAPSCARAGTLRMEASTTWAENILRSSAPIDWRDTLAFDAQGTFSAFRQLTAGLIATGAAEVAYAGVPRFSKFDLLTAGVSGQARQKFGFGPFAPTITLDTGWHRREARRDGDDGWTANGAITLGKRLTPAWRVAATGDWQQHYARSSIFDTRHHRVFGTVTWDLTDWLQLSHGNGRLWGDFTANASPLVWPRALSGALGSNISEYYNTVSWGVTDSGGPGWVTYRVFGRVSFWWLELSPALGRDTSLPLRYESRFSVNKVGIKYRQDFWSVQVLRRF